MRSIQTIEPPPAGHWVGDGFPVKSMIFYGQHGASVSPFLLLDHAAIWGLAQAWLVRRTMVIRSAA